MVQIVNPNYKQKSMKLIICDSNFNVIQAKGGLQESIRFNFHEQGKILKKGN